MFFDKQKELLQEILQEVKEMYGFAREEFKNIRASTGDIHNINLRVDTIFTRLDNNTILTEKIEAQAAEIKTLKARLAEAEQENLRVVNEDLRKANEDMRKANESLREAVGTILCQKEKDDDLLGDLKSYLKTQGHNMNELTACFDAVLGGMFDHDFIEFVALKTYRGWKYIYHDGEVYGNFDDIDKITMTTTDGGKHIDLTISRKDAKQC